MIPDFDEIAAGLLIKDKKVLVAQRKEGSSQSLKWEFPGGTLQKEEKYDEALIREFKEELGISIEVDEEIGSVEYKEGEKVLIIMFFTIIGDPSGINLNEHNDSKFVNFAELAALDLSGADKVFIENFKDNIKKYID